MCYLQNKGLVQTSMFFTWWLASGWMGQHSQNIHSCFVRIVEGCKSIAFLQLVGSRIQLVALQRMYSTVALLQHCPLPWPRSFHNVYSEVYFIQQRSFLMQTECRFIPCNCFQVQCRWSLNEKQPWICSLIQRGSYRVKSDILQH